MNEFWAVLYKRLTEPYMSKYQKEEVFNKIKRQVFEDRSYQIKKAKFASFQAERNAKPKSSPGTTSTKHSSTDKTTEAQKQNVSVVPTLGKMNAYNLDNNDLDYIVFK